MRYALALDTIKRGVGTVCTTVAVSTVGSSQEVVLLRVRIPKFTLDAATDKVKSGGLGHGLVIVLLRMGLTVSRFDQKSFVQGDYGTLKENVRLVASSSTCTHVHCGSCTHTHTYPVQYTQFLQPQTTQQAV